MGQGIKSRFSGAVKKFQTAYNDTKRKSLVQMSKEFLIASVNSKHIATNYFTSFLYRKNINNYLDYVCHQEWEYLQRVICDSGTFAVQDNKLFLQQYFENAKMPMPELLAYSIREKMIVKNDKGWSQHEIMSSEAFHEIINELLTKSSNNAIFIKPCTGSGGKGALRISKRNNELPNEIIPRFLESFLSGSYIFQDEVKQNKKLALLNPSTLNSMRIDTFKKPGAKPEILSAFLRVGRSNKCVDNTGSGGVWIGINLSDGTLKEFGFTDITAGGLLQNIHPDTGITFKGFQIPLFEEAKQLVVDAASWLPKSLVGWDIAISEHGPVLIECNSIYYNMAASDIAYGGYRKNPVYCKVVDYVKNDLKKLSLAK
jgi:hypothetical protein